MTRKTVTMSQAYFEEKYRSDIDPWRFRSSAYEREKYESTLRGLTRPIYGRALEVGCSIGVFTNLLAPKCEQVVAIDASETAIAAAKELNIPNVDFLVQTLPDEFPGGQFDLIVLSEVLYYFAEPDLGLVADKCTHAIAQDGELLLCHWLGETDYPLTGQQASEIFAAKVLVKMPVRTILRDDVYRLERFSFA